ncbi:E3 ubiquitin-protein ligase TRIM21-like [Notolabrus celidotus]|uniref:E3 ubiquitin-protein ligase TRIM21-like n=1 Tax=Notolabrus celidotus TaxID=1203425 RepID=UPI0014905C25|nr:E3 ubiquitin-protein ligase TRIM21-like [Notolabrus celidotus]
MEAASCFLPEDQFLCSICLDVFTHPVTIPCGHNFCKDCISEHWSTKDQCLCPMCKKVFSSKPDLYINTFISEMVAQFRDKAQQEASSSSSEQQESKPGEVLCDICTGTKLKALKSCLDCLVSYCETHLELHLTAPRLKRHQLIDAVENLEDRMCPKHDKPLELFCKTDQTCVCVLCSVLDHKTHEFVPLGEEYEDKKAELEETDAEIQEMIQNRRVKIQEIKLSADLGKRNPDREMAEGVRVFTALKESVERGQAELMDSIKEKQKTAEQQDQDFIHQLEEEISELKKRSSEVKQLSGSEDHLHLLQRVQSLNINHPPPTKDWTQVNVCPTSHWGTVVGAAAQLEETLRKEMKKLLQAELRAAAQLGEALREEMRKLLQAKLRAAVQQEETLIGRMKKLLAQTELKRVQQYAADVTLDPDTAHPKLILSDDGKQVRDSDVWKNLPNNPERFSPCVYVLGKQSFSSGRFYFEVQVQGKTEWTFGVARESIDRKGLITARPQFGFWSLCLRNGKEYKALDNPPVLLSLRSQPEKVGVFVDYEEGLVSFHDVDSAALIYSFTGCSFTSKLHPYFGPSLNYKGKNSAPLIITPVNRERKAAFQDPTLKKD